ncbi:type II secretion system GspH family protein [Rubripirellula sp.]|jgi:type II secretory pathway pseudopilin PulG|nr:type II secretion system GspH family protein [Rubripirellula sp.]MDF1843067.1 type II secretion system protein [Rubripirellula sp.]
MRKIKRHAFTLIELLVVMTAGMTVLMLTTGMIHKTMHIASTNQARMDQSIVIDRLAREFRYDAHRASSFEVDQGVKFTLRDSSVIHYRIDENRITRKQSLDGQPISRESFELGENRTAVLDSPQPEHVQLTIQTMTPKPRIDRTILTIVGRWTIPEPSKEELQ